MPATANDARPPSLLKPEHVCRVPGPLEGSQFVSHLATLGWYKGQNVHVERLPRREAKFAKTRVPLGTPVVRALAGLGVEKLYEH